MEDKTPNTLYNIGMIVKFESARQLINAYGKIVRIVYTRCPVLEEYIYTYDIDLLNFTIANVETDVTDEMIKDVLVSRNSIVH